MTPPKPFRIMVAIDWSPQGTHALELAADITERVPHGELHVLHVVADASGARANERAYMLRYEVSEVCDPRAVSSAHLYVRVGEAAREIIDLVAEIGADMIVLGEHRADALRTYFVKSISGRVTRAVSCPVVFAGPPQRTIAGERARAATSPTAS